MSLLVTDYSKAVAEAWESPKKPIDAIKRIACKLNLHTVASLMY
jgi:hypothetical protein